PAAAAARALGTLAGARAREHDPELLDACRGLDAALARVFAMDDPALRFEVREREPGAASLLLHPAAVDRLCLAFGEAADTHSRWRSGHSPRVAAVAGAIADQLGWDAARRAILTRAAWLHDLGIFSVPAAVLDSPAPPDDLAWQAIRLHPWYSRHVLEGLPEFAEVAAIAAAHHERLDGRGYFQGLRGGQLSPEACVLAVADEWDALTHARPFRPALAPQQAMGLLARDAGVGVWADAVAALAAISAGPPAQAPARAA
ncbi:MAG TPA: HD domain-containing phosphohydrolase, partial [Candidatus Eisenbacteria bacterium]|nr:HD domain-containing phosphohydrolase [Candidatus Eisenbacteria bacterium]